MGDRGAVDPERVRELVESAVFEELGQDAGEGLTLMARWGTLDVRCAQDGEGDQACGGDRRGLVHSA